MRRSATEIINNLEMRVARLEKSAGQRINYLDNVMEGLERYNKIEILSDYNTRDLGTKVHAPHPNDVRRAISRNKKIMVHAVDGRTRFTLNWRHL